MDAAHCVCLGVDADVGQESIESTSVTSLHMPTSTATDLTLVSLTSSYDDVTSPVKLDDDAAMKVLRHCCTKNSFIVYSVLIHC